MLHLLMGMIVSLVSLLCLPPPGPSRSVHLSLQPPTLPRCGKGTVPNLGEEWFVSEGNSSFVIQVCLHYVLQKRRQINLSMKQDLQVIYRV